MRLLVTLIVIKKRPNILIRALDSLITQRLTAQPAVAYYL